MKGVAAATTATLKNSTLKWLDTIIVGRKLCPFAPSVRHAPKLSLCISDATNDDDVLQAVRTEANLITQGILRAEGTTIRSTTATTTTHPLPPSAVFVTLYNYRGKSKRSVLILSITTIRTTKSCYKLSCSIHAPCMIPIPKLRRMRRQTRIRRRVW